MDEWCFRLFCRRGRELSGNVRENFAHGAFGVGVVGQRVGDINESDVDFRIGRNWLSAKTVGLAQTPPHGDAVNGMAQPFFGDGYHELRTICAASGVQPPYGTPRVGHNAIVPAVLFI